VSVVSVLAWAGNAAFFSRFLLQWRLSEKAGRPVAPRAFFWLSLFGALALGVYAFHAGEPILLAGYALTILIYARNLWLRDGRALLSPASAMVAGLAVLGALVILESFELRELRAGSRPWLLVGGVGQLVWSARFVVQWWASERTGASHFPRSFWWLSLVGNGLLLAYALHLGDAPFVLGFLIGPFVQVRNLMLAYRREAPLVRASAHAS
jgi:lipid-A-disaccharide synthase-like uncharacterized protein